MTLVSINTERGWPGHCDGWAGVPAISNDITLDAAGESESYIAVAREAMTISHVGFRNGTATGSPTAEVRIETVATDGTPSGTLWAANTNATSGTLMANTWNLIALTASALIAAGQAFAVLVKYASGTAITTQRMSNYRTSVYNLPLEVPNVGGVETKTRPVGAKLISVGSGATTFYSLINALAANTIAANAFNNTNAAARGLRFKVPFKCRCIGIRHYQGTANGDYNAVMYDDAGNELSTSSTAFDGNLSVENAGGVSTVYFDNPVTLEKDTWYRAALEPSSATNINMYTATLPSADYRSAWPGGVNQHYATRSSGAWTDTDTDQVPLMDIIIDQVDDGTGTGGSGGGGIISS